MPKYTVIPIEMEMVTPGFIGGADHVCRGIDPKSIKSALRYWWRVLYGGHIASEGSGGQAEALKQLHREEMRLFGEVAKNEGGHGQGLVQLVVNCAHAMTGTIPHPVGIEYLLGQGLYDPKKKSLRRNPLLPSKFSAKLIFFHPDSDQVPLKDRQQVLNAMKAFGLLGGLGARQNRGFGSVALRKVGDLPFAHDRASYLSEVKQLFAHPHPHLPLLPAFCDEARCKLIFVRLDATHRVDLVEVPAPAQENGHVPIQSRKMTKIEIGSIDALQNLIGEQFLLERSWGRKPYPKAPNSLTSGNHIAEQNYEEDHDLIKDALSGNPGAGPHANAIPLRSVYGLPYLFGKDAGMNLLLPNSANKLEPTRRGSPFHIHMTKLEDGIAAVLYTLPSKFLPDNVPVELGNLKPRKSHKITFDWRVIDLFLARFPSAHTLHQASS